MKNTQPPLWNKKEVASSDQSGLCFLKLKAGPRNFSETKNKLLKKTMDLLFTSFFDPGFLRPTRARARQGSLTC